MALGSAVLTFSCEEQHVFLSPHSQCEFVDLQGWVAAGLSQEDVVYRPFCPQVFYHHAEAKHYEYQLRTTDYSHLGITRLSWYDNQRRKIGAPQQQDIPIYFTAGDNNTGYANVQGSYLAATDSSVTAGIDYGRLEATSSGTQRLAEARFTYRGYFPGQPSVTPTAPVTGETVIFAVDVSGEYRPITIEWFVDGVSQGAASEAATSFNSVWTSAGSHSIAAHIVPPEDSPFPTPYTLSISIEVTQGELCGGGPGQTPCTLRLPTSLKDLWQQASGKSRDERARPLPHTTIPPTG